MKKLLLIALLIVGCSKDSPAESSVDPIVGVWELVQRVYTFTELECNEHYESSGWTQTAQELQMAWLINIDGSFVYSSDNIVDSNAGYDGEFLGTGV